jgi:hypothetical protein
MTRIRLFIAFILLAIGVLLFGPEWASRTIEESKRK